MKRPALRIGQEILVIADFFPVQLLWKRALKDRFKYVRRPIDDDEQVLRNKCKFGHRRGQTRKSSSAENKPEDIQVQVRVEIFLLVLNWVLCLFTPPLTGRPLAGKGENRVISPHLNLFCIEFVLKPDLLAFFFFHPGELSLNSGAEPDTGGLAQLLSVGHGILSFF